MRSLFLLLLLTFSHSAFAAKIEALTSGLNHVCALTSDKEVICWGDNRYDQLNVPPLENPIALHSGYTYSCALEKISEDNTNVKCWGRDEDFKSYKQYWQTQKPNPWPSTQPCVAGPDKNSFSCWDDGKTNFFRFETCDLNDNNTLTCPNESSVTGYKTFSMGQFEAKKIATSSRLVCGLNDSEVKCWHNFDGQEIVKGLPGIPPVINKPKFLVAGKSYFCAATEENVTCWPDYMRLEFSTPAFEPTPEEPKFKHYEVNKFFSVVAISSAPVRNNFLNQLSDYAKKNLTLESRNENYLLALLAGPAINMADSEYYLTTAQPAYNKSLQKIAAFLNISSISEIPANTALAQQTALKVMQVSISVMNEFLSAEDRRKTQIILSLLAQAMVKPSRPSALAATKAVHSNEAIFAKLKDSSKASFLVATLELATEWLDEKEK